MRLQYLLHYSSINQWSKNEIKCKESGREMEMKVAKAIEIIIKKIFKWN